MKKIFFLLVFILNTFICYAKDGGVSFTQSFFKFSPDKPIKISSEVLIITELKRNFYQFDYRKNVTATQDKNKIYSDELIVYYDKNQKKINKIIIIGNVKIKGENAICSCDYGKYYPQDKKIYLKGHIKILQDKNLFNGDELSIDLIKNIATLKGKGKRINTIFGGGK